VKGRGDGILPLKMESTFEEIGRGGDRLVYRGITPGLE